jgi:hypothetical protein
MFCGRGQYSVPKVGPTSNIMHLGKLGYSNNSGYTPMHGGLAEWTWFSAKLTGTEIQALSRGENPFVVRGSAVEVYAPLYGQATPELIYGNQAGAITVSTVGAPTPAPHPNVWWRNIRDKANSNVGIPGSMIFVPRSFSLIGTKLGQRQPLLTAPTPSEQGIYCGTNL